MKDEESTITRNGHTDRILLHPETLVRVEHWMENIHKDLKGVKLTKADLVNRLLLTRPKDLTSEEKHQIGQLYFDEVRFANWALVALKEAKSNGRSTTLRDLVSQFGKDSSLNQP